MGCIHSRSICEAHLNRFEVIFMDIERTESYIPGQIEITGNLRFFSYDKGTKFSNHSIFFLLLS